LLRPSPPAATRTDFLLAIPFFGHIIRSRNPLLHFTQTIFPRLAHGRSGFEPGETISFGAGHLLPHSGSGYPANSILRAKLGTSLLALSVYAFSSAQTQHDGIPQQPRYSLTQSARPLSTTGTTTGWAERGDGRLIWRMVSVLFHSFVLLWEGCGWKDGSHAEERVNGKLEAHPRSSFPAFNARVADGDVALISSAAPSVLSSPSPSVLSLLPPSSMTS
jgi:hypothetical protein